MADVKSMLKTIKKRIHQDSRLNGDDEPHILHVDLPPCRRRRHVSKSVLVNNLPSLRDCAPSQRKKLLIKKLRLCSYVFDFSDAPESKELARKKDLKRAALLELVNHLSVVKPSFAEDELKEIFAMLRSNIFRPLPPSTWDILGGYNPEEDEPQSEPTWPHLQVVYEFLLRLATSPETDTRLLDKFFSREFVLQLIELFDSEDPRERDYLKTILHRIYGNFMSLRPFIRKAIHNVIFRFLYQTKRHNGIAELLEILGSIINGFALPLKEQHKVFLHKVLIPMHKADDISVFHPQLSYCVNQFLQKDPTLAPAVVKGLVKYWPTTNSKKQLMFLTEVEEMLDRVQSHHLGGSQVHLFQQLAKCVNSPHFQISERAIYVLNNDVILRFVAQEKEDLFPIITRALYSNAQKWEGKDSNAGPWRWQERGHWNPTIVELTNEVIKLLTDMDEELMEQCSKEHLDQVSAYRQDRQRRVAIWTTLKA